MKPHPIALYIVISDRRKTEIRGNPSWISFCWRTHSSELVWEIWYSSEYMVTVVLRLWVLEVPELWVASLLIPLMLLLHLPSRPRSLAGSPTTLEPTREVVLTSVIAPDYKFLLLLYPIPNVIQRSPNQILSMFLLPLL